MLQNETRILVYVGKFTLQTSLTYTNEDKFFPRSTSSSDSIIYEDVPLDVEYTYPYVGPSVPA